MGKMTKKKDGEYLAWLKEKTRHKASIIFNEQCVPDLASIATTDPEVKNRLSAMQMLGKLSGDLRPQPNVAIQFNFGNKFEELEQKRIKGQVIDIFAIKDPSKEDEQG